MKNSLTLDFILSIYKYCYNISYCYCNCTNMQIPNKRNSSKLTNFGIKFQLQHKYQQHCDSPFVHDMQSVTCRIRMHQFSCPYFISESMALHTQAHINEMNCVPFAFALPHERPSQVDHGVHIFRSLFRAPIDISVRYAQLDAYLLAMRNLLAGSPACNSPNCCYRDSTNFSWLSIIAAVHG